MGKLSIEAQTKYDVGKLLSALDFCLLPMNKDLWDSDNFHELRLLYEIYKEDYVRTIPKT